MPKAARAADRRTKPFVGRRSERALLRHLWHGADEGQAAIVVITGVAGSGKTALLRWLAGEAARAGAAVTSTTGGDEWLPPARYERLLRPLGTRLAPPGASPARSDAEDGQELEDQLADRVTDALLATARRRFVVVVFDDVHDLDTASSRILTRVVEAIDADAVYGAARLLVTLASREPIESGGPVERAMRLGSGRALSLGRLDEEDVAEFAALTGAPTSPGAIATIVEDTGGLPLLVEAAITTSGDAISGERGSPRVRTVADALARRFEKVDAETRRLLAVAAHLGEPWSVADVVAVVAEDAADEARRASNDDVRDRLGAAEAAGLVAAERDVWRFAHPLLRTQLLDRTVPADSRALHLRIGRAIAARSRGGDADVIRVADHLLRAGDGLDVAERAALGRRAGDAARRAGAWRQASDFLAAAADAAASSGAPPHERARCRYEAGQAAYMDTDPDRAERELGAAVVDATEAGDHGLAAEAAVLLVRTRLGERPLALGRRPEIGELDTALQAGDLEPKLVLEGHATMAEALFVSGETDRALTLVARARAADVGDDAARERCRLEFAEGLHRLARLELREAEACFGRARDHATVAGDALWSIVSRSRSALVRWMRGDVVNAARSLDDLVVEGEQRRYFGEAGFAAAQLVALQALVGGDGNDVVERALTLYRRSGHAFSAIVADPAVVALAARLGDADPPGWTHAVDGPARRPSAVATLTAIEAGEADLARSRAGAGKWRRGLIGPASIGNLAMVVAMVEAGDLFGDRGTVAAAERPLAALAEAEVVVVVGWPALVPRLQATAARWAGRYDEARWHLDHAVVVCDQNGLGAERARAALEEARLMVAQRADRTAVASAVGAAIRQFDELGMVGWVRRADDLAEALGVGSLAGVARGVRERTFLTTDIVGSTAANAQLGDALYLEQLRIHDRLVTGRIRQFHGQVIKHTGDGLNACFDRPQEAVECALALRDDMERWRADEPELALGVRCGIARGSVVPSGGDYFGLAQSETARLCALAGAGEVVASAAVVEQVTMPDVRLTDLGVLALRGLPEPTRAFRVAR